MENESTCFKDAKESAQYESRDDIEAPRFTLEAMPSLPLLPDDCLLHIIKYLGPVELHNLCEISDRLRSLIEQTNFWTRLDFRPNRLTMEELSKFEKYFQVSTKFLAIRGPRSKIVTKEWRRGLIKPELLESIKTKCPYLDTLIIEEYFAQESEVQLSCFPSHIRHLSLKGCVVAYLEPMNSYFKKMHISFPFLRVLVLTDCYWVSPHDFMGISKCCLLEELRMDKCPQLGECVAYTSLAARFGFQSLKILDLRETRMGDSDVGCFSRCRTLTHLYLQCPPPDTINDGMCWDPTCMDLPFRGDSPNSSEDEETAAQRRRYVPGNRAREQALLPRPVVVVPAGPRCMKIVCRPRRRVHNTSSNSSSTVREEVDREAEGNNEEEGTSQASASDGTSHITVDPAGSSSATSEQNRKRPLSEDESEASSDGNRTSPHFQPEQDSVKASDNALNGTSKGPDSTTEGPSSSLKKQTLHSGKDSCRTNPKRHRSDTGPVPSGQQISQQNISKTVGDVSHLSDTVPVPGCCTSDQKILQSAQVEEPENVNETTGDVNHLPDTNQVPPPVPCCSSSGQQVTAPVQDEAPRNAIETDDDANQETDSDNEYHHERIGPMLQIHCGAPRGFRFSGPQMFRNPHHEPSNESTISDFCILSFAQNDNEANVPGYIRIGSPLAEGTRPQLHTVVVRDYKTITDTALLYLQKLPSLRYLDVSGTSVTEDGVLRFRLNRPEVELVCDFENLPM